MFGDQIKDRINVAVALAPSPCQGRDLSQKTGQEAPRLQAGEEWPFLVREGKGGLPRLFACYARPYSYPSALWIR